MNDIVKSADESGYLHAMIVKQLLSTVTKDLSDRIKAIETVKLSQRISGLEGKQQWIILPILVH